MSSVVATESKQTYELRFTGNWFIDAGILGFVNLMEEVYGIEFNKIFSKNFTLEDFYYGYFIYYIKKTSINWIKRQELTKKAKKDENITKQFNKVKTQLINHINKIKLSELPSETGMNVKIIRENIKEFNSNIKNLIIKNFKNFKNILNKPFKNNKASILDNLSKIGFIISEPFFQNLNFINPSKNKNGNEDNILKSFENMIYKGRIKKEGIKNAFDKTITKYLFSETEFPNVIYGRIATINDLDRMLNTETIKLLLCFPISFKQVFNRYLLFYTPNLETTYKINKRLDILLSRAKEEKSDLIFKITWQSIIDYLVENKANFALENMYLIEYRSIQNQNIIGVEYIGVSKLQASILIEDPIRDSLNVNLQIDRDTWVWILEEFIKNESLYDVISRHVFYCLKEKNGKGIYRRTSLYSLAIDAKIKENNRIDLFSDDFFKGYRNLVRGIKNCYSTLNLNANKISQLFNNDDERRQICYSLISSLKKRNRITFVNILLKKFVEKAGNKETSRLTRFVFENIVTNDLSWEDYALALIVGILSFGGEAGEGEESEI